MHRHTGKQSRDYKRPLCAFLVQRGASCDRLAIASRGLRGARLASSWRVRREARRRCGQCRSIGVDLRRSAPRIGHPDDCPSRPRIPRMLGRPRPCRAAREDRDEESARMEHEGAARGRRDRRGA
ncbi:hypothetical protein C6V08_15460 [Burkholderia gladioli]|nr:hypothetical protein C6V08_15460 [Burkholderia gladioli]